MSRGPGRWQRAILDRLHSMATDDVTLLVDVVHDNANGEPTRADMTAARRAAKCLAEKRQIRAGSFWVNLGGRRTHAIGFTRPDSQVESTCRPGETVPSWHTCAGGGPVARSDRQIARELGASPGLVARVRRENG